MSTRSSLGVLVVAAFAIVVTSGTLTRAEKKPDFVCWDTDDGGVECDEYADFRYLCDRLDNVPEICQQVPKKKPLGLAAPQGNGSPSKPKPTARLKIVGSGAGLPQPAAKKPAPFQPGLFDTGASLPATGVSAMGSAGRSAR
jgi:hypothetical protein